MADTETEPHEPAAGARDQFAALELVGGRVCLDFVNTVDPRVGDRQRDYLASYAALVRWSEYSHLLTAEQRAALLRAAARRPNEAAAVFERATALREVLYRVFTAVAAQQPAEPADLAALHTAYVETMAQGRLVPAVNGYVWRWPEETRALDQMLWPIIRSAQELLTSPDVQRVKVCPGLGDCGWLFLDTSKNGRRRWCSMESCGSRSKMRRYYARTHAKSTS